MKQAKINDWVQIHSIVLEPEERSPRLPEDTTKVALEVFQKGFITQDAQIGDEVEIKTVIGRKAKGKLVDINPTHDHSFGKPVPELLTIGKELREFLEGDKK